MVTDKMDSAFVEPNNAPAQPELLVSAVLHLMSHYTASNQETKSCVKLASVIERHLKALADLPNLAPRFAGNVSAALGTMGDRSGTNDAAT